MPHLDARLDRMENAIHGLTSVTAELVRENRALVQGLAGDRAALRETLHELSGFVATAGIALERLERQVGRLAEITEAGFARLELALLENNRLILENNRLILENNAVIRRLLDILARGRGNGEGPPAVQ
jgi:regulator of replication initiation timing